MKLQEILQQIIDNGDAMLLSDSEKDWSASDLLQSLSERRLKTQAHMQQGMYIAEINPGGYLGTVLYRIKQKA